MALVQFSGWGGGVAFFAEEGGGSGGDEGCGSGEGVGGGGEPAEVAWEGGDEGDGVADVGIVFLLEKDPGLAVVAEDGGWGDGEAGLGGSGSSNQALRARPGGRGKGG